MIQRPRHRAFAARPGDHAHPRRLLASEHGNPGPVAAEGSARRADLREKHMGGGHVQDHELEAERVAGENSIRRRRCPATFNPAGRAPGPAARPGSRVPPQ